MWKKILWRIVVRLKRASDTMIGMLVAVVLRLVRRIDRKKSAAGAARVLTIAGPWLREQRIGRENLKAAFPEKSPDEIERILVGVWDNLGRVAGEFAHIDRLTVEEPSRPVQSDIEYGPETLARFEHLRASQKPSLIFAAHLANWELPARVAASYGLDAAVLYRPPNIGQAAEAIARVRKASMGTLIPSGPDAPFRLASALEQGKHVAMLVDQHFARGVDVTFFGRRCRANPAIARLARHFDCPIHGARIIRLDGDRFRAELTEAITVSRDQHGQIDVQGTMQTITSIIEGWVREHPEQWLWLHRRWR